MNHGNDMFRCMVLGSYVMPVGSRIVLIRRLRIVVFLLIRIGWHPRPIKSLLKLEKRQMFYHLRSQNILRLMLIILKLTK